MDTTGLAGMGVGYSRGCDACVRLSHNALVSALAGPGLGYAHTEGAIFASRCRKYGIDPLDRD